MHLCPAIRRRNRQKGNNRGINHMGPHSAFNHHIVVNSSPNVISSALATTPAHTFDGNSFSVHYNSISSHPFTSIPCNRLGFIFVSAEAPTGHCSSCVVYRAVIALCHCLAAQFAPHLHGAAVVQSSSLAHRPFIHPSQPCLLLLTPRAPAHPCARLLYTH
ncbi:unnamed protein product [Taenia asiatica]|uniref:Phorbol-ester/DAG-type domain-containing protein n=1 Tax=Taenia asiatica TaxID=60517 RepID=A0A0R3W394_TAEAS|nr:unnamed protein product [Taenia asiatica]